MAPLTMTPERVRLKNSCGRWPRTRRTTSSKAKRSAVGALLDDPEPGASDWQTEAARPLEPGAPVLARACAAARQQYPECCSRSMSNSRSANGRTGSRAQYFSLALTDATLALGTFKHCQPAERFAARTTRQGSHEIWNGAPMSGRSRVLVRNPIITSRRADRRRIAVHGRLRRRSRRQPDTDLAQQLSRAGRGATNSPARMPMSRRTKCFRRCCRNATRRSQDGFITWGVPR